MREFVFFLGRVLFSLVLLGSAFGHLTQTEGSTQYASYKGVPNPKAMVQLTGVLMALGGAAVVLGIWMDLAGLCIAVLMIIFAVKMHAFWNESDPMQQNAERAQFMKNIAIAGGGLILATFYIAPWTLTDGVFKP
jgi:uncharacterized membrane protein YphA (DoxX/SURF4 family)